ncbi:MAG: AbrB/MazE/SpoVT family DNA-binding domain-containing protein [Thaumarchaeota archaeon]|nr:AbrB/MazE/SpoVT family DNA-binding domain-containing protein [Nitrososphaerota archaeon]
MSEETVKVTRKGQVTIPATYRKKLRIREGTRLIVLQNKDTIVMKPIPNIEDLAGAHAGKITLEEMKKELNWMRSEDRY